MQQYCNSREQVCVRTSIDCEKNLLAVTASEIMPRPYSRTCGSTGVMRMHCLKAVPHLSGFSKSEEFGFDSPTCIWRWCVHLGHYRYIHGCCYFFVSMADIWLQFLCDRKTQILCYPLHKQCSRRCYLLSSRATVCISMRSSGDWGVEATMSVKGNECWIGFLSALKSNSV